MIPSPKGNFHPLALLLDHHTLPAATHQTPELRFWLAQRFPCGLVGASSLLAPLSNAFSVTHGALSPLLRAVVACSHWTEGHPWTFQAGLSLVAQLMGISEHTQARTVRSEGLNPHVRNRSPIPASLYGSCPDTLVADRPYMLQESGGA